MRPCRAIDHWSSGVLRQRKDWPQRRVVFMQSSVRLMGRVRHSEGKGASIADVCCGV